MFLSALCFGNIMTVGFMPIGGHGPAVAEDTERFDKIEKSAVEVKDDLL